MTSITASAAIAVPQLGNTRSDLWEEALNALSTEDRKQYVDSSTTPHEVLQKVTQLYSPVIDVYHSVGIMAGLNCIP